MANKEVEIKITADTSNVKKEVKEVEKQVEQLQKSGEKATTAISTSAESVSGGVQGIGSALGGVTKLLGPIGVAVGAAFSVKKVIDFAVAVGETGMAFETSMSKVSAISGATGEELDKLSNYARQMAQTTTFSASETADAMQYMSLAGWQSTEIMDGLKGVLDLAAAGQLDLAFASDTVTDTLSMFGMTAKESGRMVDVMATSQAKSNTNIEQLSEALRYAGGTAKTFGMDIEQTAAALGILANNGIKGSVAGSGLRSILSRLAAPTKEVTNGLETLGVTVKDETGNLKPFNQILAEMKGSFDSLGEAQQVQVAKQIAGQEAMSGFIALLGSADGELQSLTDQMYNSNGAAEKMASTMNDNLAGSIKIMKSAWEEVKLKLYDVGEGAARCVVDGLTGIMEAFNNLGDTGLAWKDGFGATVSEATSNAVINFQDMNRSIQGTIDQMGFLGGTVTQEFYNNMTTTLNTWKTESDTLLAQKYADDLTALQEYFNNHAEITDAERQNMTDKLNEFYGREREEQQRQADEMLSIIQTAYNERGYLTENELARLKELQNRNYADLLNMAANSQEEELALLQAAADEKGIISAEASEKAYANAKETRDKIVEEAKQTRDEDIKQAHRLKEAGVIQEKEYDDMVKTAKDKYSEIESKANESFREVYRAVSQNAIDMGKDFNFETGKIENQWLYFCKFVTGKIAQFDAVYRVNVEHTTTYNTKQGTNSSSRFARAASALNFGSPQRSAISIPQSYDVSALANGREVQYAAGSGAEYLSDGSININMSGVVVREEADIKKIAQELYKLQQRNKRGKGVIAYV